MSDNDIPERFAVKIKGQQIFLEIDDVLLELSFDEARELARRLVHASIRTDPSPSYTGLSHDHVFDLDDPAIAVGVNQDGVVSLGIEAAGSGLLRCTQSDVRAKELARLISEVLATHATVRVQRRKN